MNANVAALVEILENITDIDVAADLCLDLGMRRIGSGSYSTVYRLDNLCVKLSHGGDDFNYLQGVIKSISTSELHAYIPKIYWVSESGEICICEYVEIDKDTMAQCGYWELFEDTWQSACEYVCGLFNRAGVGLSDMHKGNFVVDKRGFFKIVDYGCFT
jgi:hypothetical protein